MSTGEANVVVVRVEGDTISGVWNGDQRAACALMQLLPGSAIATGQLRGPVGEGPPRESDTFGKFTALCDASGRAPAFSPAGDWDKELLRDVRRFTAVRVTAADEEAKMLFGEWRGLQHEVRMAVAAMLLVSVKQVTLRGAHGAPAGPDDLDGLWTVACPTAMWRRLREILVPPQVTTPRGPADDDLLLAGPNAPNYSAFILHDNGAWEQPDFRISTPKDATVSRDVVVRMLKTHYRGFAVYGLAESEDCPPGSETAILVPPKSVGPRGPTDEETGGQGEPVATAESTAEKGDDPQPPTPPHERHRSKPIQATDWRLHILADQANGEDFLLDWGPEAAMRSRMALEAAQGRDVWLTDPNDTKHLPEAEDARKTSPSNVFWADDRIEPDHRPARITVTHFKDFAVWGTWQGNQHGAVDLITDIDGLEDSNPMLFAMDGKAAGSNVFEGEWMARPPKMASWKGLHDRFGDQALKPEGPHDPRTFEDTERLGSITVTRLKPYSVLGTWKGNQYVVVDLIKGIEGLQGSNPILWATDGSVAGSDVSEGEWMARADLGSWTELLQRFGKEVQ